LVRIWFEDKGIGLALVRKVVDRMDGKVGVESDVMGQ
jgi:signal transduction histidine kinase